MTAIPNQLTDLSSLISLNGTEITEHGRTFSSDYLVNGNTVSLSRGIDKKYFKKSKRTFSLSFRMLPSSTDHTVDGRAGRNFLRTIVEAKSSIAMSVKDSSNSYSYSTTVFISSYSENLLRRDYENGYDFYDISITLEEA